MRRPSTPTFEVRTSREARMTTLALFMNEVYVLRRRLSRGRSATDKVTDTVQAIIRDEVPVRQSLRVPSVEERQVRARDNENSFCRMLIPRGHPQPEPWPERSPRLRIHERVPERRADWSRGQILGDGTFGQIMQVQWNGQQAAVKFLRDYDEALAEIWASQACGPHENIMSMLTHWGLNTYTDDNAGKLWCVAFPLADMDLQKYLLRLDQHLLAGEVYELWAQLLAGLIHLHGKDLVHMDLKPANILLRQDSRRTAGWILQLGDLGSVMKVRETLIWETCTLWWRAPELYLVKDGVLPRASPHADIWSAGLVFSDLAQAPFRLGLLQGQSLEHQYTLSYRLAQTLKDSKGPLASCLRWNPEERPSAMELERRFQEVPKKSEDAFPTLTDNIQLVSRPAVSPLQLCSELDSLTCAGLRRIRTASTREDYERLLNAARDDAAQLERFMSEREPPQGSIVKWCAAFCAYQWTLPALLGRFIAQPGLSYSCLCGSEPLLVMRRLTSDLGRLASLPLKHDEQRAPTRFFVCADNELSADTNPLQDQHNVYIALLAGHFHLDPRSSMQSPSGVAAHRAEDYFYTPLQAGHVGIEKCTLTRIETRTRYPEAVKGIHGLLYSAALHHQELRAEVKSCDETPECREGVCCCSARVKVRVQMPLGASFCLDRFVPLGQLRERSTSIAVLVEEEVYKRLPQALLSVRPPLFTQWRRGERTVQCTRRP